MIVYLVLNTDGTVNSVWMYYGSAHDYAYYRGLEVIEKEVRK
jgi:hypothetical protein